MLLRSKRPRKCHFLFSFFHFSLGYPSEMIPSLSLFSGKAAISVLVDEQNGTLVKLQRLILLEVILHKLQFESLIRIFPLSTRPYANYVN